VASRDRASRRRRRPIQRRAQQTIDAILDGAVQVLKSGRGQTIATGRGQTIATGRGQTIATGRGQSITTNHIARAAGVSIGSLYQYFADKRAIFAALHDRHVEQASRRIDAALVTNAGAPLEVVLRALMHALIEAHAADPELYLVLDAELPHGGRGGHPLHERLRSALRPALAAGTAQVGRELETTAFVVTHLLDALVHGAILNRPPRVSLRRAQDQFLQAILRYLRL